MIVPVCCVVNFREFWQCTDELAEVVFEADLQRTDIDRPEAGRATAAYVHQGVRDYRLRHDAVMITFDAVAAALEKIGATTKAAS